MCNLINTHTHSRTGVETRRRTADGNGNRNRNGDESENSSGDGNGDDDNGNGNVGLRRAEERRKSARNRKIVVDGVRETGETRMEREKNVEKKGLVQ